jgi:sugar lactone lactonase YvrE
MVSIPAALNASPPDATISFIGEFGTSGTDPGQFQWPTDVDGDSAGNLYVVEFGTSRIQRCTNTGQCEIFADQGGSRSNRAEDIVIDADGNALLAGEHRIIMCEAVGGACSTLFGSSGPGTDLGRFNDPRGIDLGTQGRIVVADRHNHRIQVCDYDGSCFAFGTENCELDAPPGEFCEPNGLVTDRDGTIYTSENGSEVIHRCDESGTCTARLGTPSSGGGSGLGEFAAPNALALTSRGDLFVVDQRNGRVQLCNPSGDSFEDACIAFGREGSGPGEFDGAEGVYIDAQDRAFVAEIDNHRIQILQITYQSPPPFKIDAGLNGNWWNGPARSGEGAQIEVADAGDGRLVFVATFYSYDTIGNQIFLVAVGPVDGNTAEVDVFITEGGLWGDSFDPVLVNETQWGTGTFTASSCETMHVSLIPNAGFQAMGYTDLAHDLVRLTTPAIACPLEFSD